MMTMRGIAFLSGFGLLLFCQWAHADVFEVRGRGYVNGKVLSEDGERIELQRAGGSTETLLKRDVLFREEDLPTKAAGGRNKPISFDWQSFQSFFEDIQYNFSKSMSDLGKQFPEFSKWVSDLTKPIDNKTSQRKVTILAQAIEQASDASIQMNKRTWEMNREMKHQSSE